MLIFPNEVSQYLKKYGKDKWHLELNPSQNKSRIELAIVIPAINEFNNIKKAAASLLQNNSQYFSRTIIIFVINNLCSSSLYIKQENQKSIKYIREMMKRENELHFGLIDAASPDYELSEKDGGVGYARKIGMDAALKLFNYNSPTKNIIACLDADCIVEKNYITEIFEKFNKNNLYAAVVNYKHQVDDENTKIGIICYELYLRYYELGLIFAQSPFTFHTIGSTIVCDHKSYIKTEGMNKKKAAEDFYFLQKLAKNFEIKKIRTTTVYPSSREAVRVPFGTGQRVKRFLSQKQNEYLLYDHQSLIVLKKWLEIFNSKKTFRSEYYLEEAKKINNHLYDFLLTKNFEKDWNKILSNSKGEEQIQRQKKIWFDCFKTLKLIHFLRDRCYPLKPMFMEIDNLLSELKIEVPLAGKRKGEEIPSVEIQTKYLELLRDAANSYHHFFPAAV